MKKETCAIKETVALANKKHMRNTNSNYAANKLTNEQRNTLKDTRTQASQDTGTMQNTTDKSKTKQNKSHKQLYQQTIRQTDG